MSQLAMCGHLTMGFLPPLRRYSNRRISCLGGHGMPVPRFCVTGALRPVTRVNVHFVGCSSLVARIDAANCLTPTAHMPIFFMKVTFFLFDAARGRNLSCRGLVWLRLPQPLQDGAQHRAQAAHPEREWQQCIPFLEGNDPELLTTYRRCRGVTSVVDARCAVERTHDNAINPTDPSIIYR